MNKNYIVEGETPTGAEYFLNWEDAKQKLVQLVYLAPENYHRYDLVINNKYKDIMPAIFYTALSRGYKTVEFKNLKEDIVFEISEGVIK